MVEKVELAPCPFCGGDGQYSFPYGAVDVCCTSCGMETDSYLNKEAAAAAWNRRAPSTDGISALEAIAALGGNLPDERFECAGGENDARHRGGLFVSARQIARAALSKEQGNG
jgi:hypothetical protein